MNRLVAKVAKLNSFSIAGLLLVLTLLLTWQVRDYFHSRSFQQLHLLGEDRLLSYITGIRQTLNRVSHLPYVLSQNNDVRALLQQHDGSNPMEVNRYLEQTNQIASTARWFVLGNDGHVVASSHWREHQNELNRYYGDKPFFFKARNGELGYYVELSGANDIPGYYLSAPIYADLKMIGVAVVMIDLRGLQDLWTAAQERLLVSDQAGVIFLSSLPGWRKQRLPSDESVSKAEKSEQGLPYRWRYQELQDGTEARLLLGEDGDDHMVQSVFLDDLKWQVHFLSDLKPVWRQRQAVTLFCLGGGLAIGLLLLFFRERWLRNLSRRETEELRLHNEAQQRTIISNSQVGLLTVDAFGRVLFINPRALSQFGGKEQSVLGQSIDSLIDIESSPQQLRQLSDGLAQGTRVEPINVVEGKALRLDGSDFPMLISVNPISWDDTDAYLVTLVDITLRKRAEQALQKANEELEHRVLERTEELREAQAELIQSSKLAALGTMSAAIAHELNQPLTAIRTSASSSRILLQRQQFEAVEENLSRMAEMTQRMALITSQLKTFARKRPEKPGAVAMNKVIEQVLSMFQERIEHESIILDLQIQDSVVVNGDQPRIEQVLINLIRNALDAMEKSSEKKLAIALALDHDRAQITVSDSGCGMNEDVLGHLFDPFYTTKDIGEGLGLGLSITYGIVGDLGGSIKAENLSSGYSDLSAETKNKASRSGARFKVWLPLRKTVES
ncbi:ATP-binding protein [Motiliproteus sp. MSK22-1]|uniref:sensor histidine kinase n=1 Tax=Motiliproteus sp. MSK22-1 TaxID=1897630 RepID=UPI0009765377|nr:ATP-binding protein [Motiliproteus sp. MSK22-1]OMH33983.1 hypothetical protein BGP75_13550 [Motiliproteus sp. MSK22-1]